MHNSEQGPYLLQYALGQPEAVAVALHAQSLRDGGTLLYASPAAGAQAMPYHVLLWTTWKA